MAGARVADRQVRNTYEYNYCVSCARGHVEIDRRKTFAEKRRLIAYATQPTNQKSSFAAMDRDSLLAALARNADSRQFRSIVRTLADQRRVAVKRVDAFPAQRPQIADERRRKQTAAWLISIAKDRAIGGQSKHCLSLSRDWESSSRRVEESPSSLMSRKRARTNFQHAASLCRRTLRCALRPCRCRTGVRAAWQT